MKNVLLSFIAVTLFTLTSAQQALAQDYATLLDIPEGATLIGLSVTERTEVDQDLLIANLRYEAEDFDRVKVQNEINKAMADAVKKAERVEDIKFSTQSYHIHSFNPNPRNGQRVEKWRGQQGLQIKGKNPEVLLDLVGDLQANGFAMNGLSYEVSPELMEETKNSMLEDALEKLSVKAQRTAKALGKNKSNLLQVNVDSDGIRGQPMMMARTMAMESATDAMTAPVAAPGQTNITLSVSAQALITP